MVYVFDIDGTICSITSGEYDNAEPFVERIQRVNELFNNGHTIIYNTARGMGRSSNSSAYAHAAFQELTKNQLIKWGAKHHLLLLGKPAGDIYVDDKGNNANDFFTD
jgi:hypothetical protein